MNDGAETGKWATMAVIMALLLGGGALGMAWGLAKVRGLL